MKLADVIPRELEEAELVSAQVVSRWLNVTIATIYNWAREGKLPRLVRLGRRTVRFNVGELRTALRKMDCSGAASAKE